jgi:hypothetical protein
MWVGMSSWTYFYSFFVGSQFCSYDASFGSSYISPLRASHHFVLIITLALFLSFLGGLNGMIFRGTQWLLFINQILHLANPHDKLSTVVLYSHLGFPSIHRLTLWDPRLGHFSLLSYVGRRIRDGEHEL